MQDIFNTDVLRHSAHDLQKSKALAQSIDTLARTLWGEARGEGYEGMYAVANVIMNRVALAQRYTKYWWGNTVIEVCKKPFQFSCWNATDANRDKILKLDSKNRFFKQALDIATKAVMDDLPDITIGANHYHTVAILPRWAKDKTAVKRIGNHLFYDI